MFESQSLSRRTFLQTSGVAAASLLTGRALHAEEKADLGATLMQHVGEQFLFGRAERDHAKPGAGSADALGQRIDLVLRHFMREARRLAPGDAQIGDASLQLGDC